MALPTVYQSPAGDVSNSPVGGVSQVVDPLGVARVHLRGADYTGPAGGVPYGGHFRANMITGATTGLTANQPIGSVRWTDSAHFFVLLGLRAWAQINTVFTTAQQVDIEAIVARAFTAADSGGTAMLPFSGNSQKMRDSGGAVMQASLLNDLRIATTGTLTAGTRTLDSFGFAYGQFNNSNALGNAAEVEMYRWEPGDHPLVLAANEGIIFRVPTAQGAAGKVLYAVTMKWAEVVAF